jgi:large subunit ribosomal protein L35
MPKMKTKKAAKKRFRVTPGGKIVYVHSGLRHNLENMSSKRKRQIARPHTLSPHARDTVLRLLGKR